MPKPPKIIEARLNGVDIIHQARLVEEKAWAFRADFLIKVDLESFSKL